MSVLKINHPWIEDKKLIKDGVLMHVYNRGGTIPLNVYMDCQLTTCSLNPLPSNYEGSFDTVFVLEDYDIVITDKNNNIIDINDVGEYHRLMKNQRERIRYWLKKQRNKL